VGYRKTAHATFDLNYHLVWITNVSEAGLRGAVGASFSDLEGQFLGRHLWARRYFAVTSGNVTDDVIARYIELQGDLPVDEDDFRVADLLVTFSRFPSLRL
jgi:REP element-mobilizing transposase RayT